jgi:hypothetical protein
VEVIAKKEPVEVAGRLSKTIAAETGRAVELPSPPPSCLPGSKSSAQCSGDDVLHAELKHAFGGDLSQIPGIRIGNAQALFGEIGPHFTKFRSRSAFAFWMGLCPDPDNGISGAKVLWVGTRKVSRAATALRMAATHGSSVSAP